MILVSPAPLTSRRPTADEVAKMDSDMLDLSEKMARHADRSGDPARGQDFKDALQRIIKVRLRLVSFFTNIIS